MKEYGKVKSFRISKQTWELLNKCFKILNINDESFNAKMSNFIIQAHKQLNKLSEQQKEIVISEIERKKSQRPIPNSPTVNQRPKQYEHSIGFETKSKPQPPKSEANRPPLAISKPSNSMKTIEQDDWVVCPDRDDWVKKSVECKKCGEDDFKKFSECYKERTKDPLSSLFKCSKPKPNL